jgi:hypothetical protein
MNIYICVCVRVWGGACATKRQHHAWQDCSLACMGVWEWVCILRAILTYTARALSSLFTPLSLHQNLSLYFYICLPYNTGQIMMASSVLGVWSPCRADFVFTMPFVGSYLTMQCAACHNTIGKAGGVCVCVCVCVCNCGVYVCLYVAKVSNLCKTKFFELQFLGWGQ